ncbi:unnamed protein product [Penicillium discolor]
MGSRWQNPGGWGARHILDTAPFTLWDDLNRKYRPPTKEEYQWIDNKFEYKSITISGWYIRIETNNPPNPVPLTVGYVDNVTLKALKPLANVRAVVYLPLWTVVELEYGDNRVYERMSLPRIVAGRTTMYHHAEAPFYSLMKNLTATRQLDLAQQEEPPRMLLQRKDIKPGSWAEVRCMSSGLVSLISYGKLFQKPVSGYLDIPFDRWHSYNLQACWGVGNEAISDGIGGAPIVSCENGGVIGFFHLFDGRNCFSAHLDELVADGWEVV